MAISELQMGLIGVGAAAVVGIVAYNKWQEGRHRRQAEEAFGADHPDVLLDTGRREPGGTGAGMVEELDVEAAWGSRPVKEGTTRRASPVDPAEASALADCTVRLESIEALPARRLWQAGAESLGSLGKPLRWFAFDDEANLWIQIDENSPGSHHWFAAALQLVDRRGPLGDADLLRFFNGLQRVADQFLAVPAGLPGRGEVIARANELDSFCASVDVQIGLNVVSRGQSFAGTKIRGFAEAQGWMLDADGSYHAGDADGQTLFTMSNLDGPAFSAREMRELQTDGLTFLLDVPRAPNGVLTFDRMLASARQLADTLRGEVVDDNRASFGEAEAHVIRSQVEQFQSRMHSRGLIPGDPLARRLFTA